MAILPKLALLSVLAGLIVFAVRFLIVPAIDKASLALNFGSKARGQLLGYVTSTPELTIVVASAAAGVFDAGFWNIASSNIINCVLFLCALFTFGQYRDLKRKTLKDEISFGLFSVILPLVLYRFGVQGSVLLGICLLFVFIIYKALDHRFNPRDRVSEERGKKPGSLFFPLVSMFVGLGIIVLSGWYLGGVAENLVVELGVPVWMIGWVLGFISSIPEMAGFFEIYRKYEKGGTLRKIEDTQEALDSLVASNMSNLGIILPVGVFIGALL